MSFSLKLTILNASLGQGLTKYFAFGVEGKAFSCMFADFWCLFCVWGGESGATGLLFFWALTVVKPSSSISYIGIGWFIYLFFHWCFFNWFIFFLNCSFFGFSLLLLSWILIVLKFLLWFFFLFSFLFFIFFVYFYLILALQPYMAFFTISEALRTNPFNINSHVNSNPNIALYQAFFLIYLHWLVLPFPVFDLSNSGLPTSAFVELPLCPISDV